MDTIQQKILTQTKVGMAVAQSAHYSVHESVFHDELMHRLEAFVLTEQLVNDTYTASKVTWEPASAWQMFKRDHAESWWLGWLVSRRPVKQLAKTWTVEIEFDRKAGYPQASIALPEFGKPVIYEQVKELWYE